MKKNKIRELENRIFELMKELQKLQKEKVSCGSWSLSFRTERSGVRQSHYLIKGS